MCRGTLYSVHFQPNEKGGYNEHLTIISDAYELPCDTPFPLPLIYPPALRCVNGRMRLIIGAGRRQSMLHLINRDARVRFFAEVLAALRQREDIRMEVTET